MADIDWCAKASALRARYEALRDGIAVSEAGFEGTDRTAFTRPDLDRVERDMREAERLCAEQSGQPVTRRRFAKFGRFRPY